MKKQVRIDKWLWAVRIFKSRTISSDACKRGKVRINEKICKSSSAVSADDLISVHKNGFNLQFQVLELLEKRVSASIARTCYKDLTPEEELSKYNDWYKGKSNAEVRIRGAGRPTKKERREIDLYKTDQFDEDPEK